MEAGRVNEGNTAHTDYPDDRFFMRSGAHHFVKFSCGSEEEGTVNLIYGYALGEVEEFVVVRVGFGTEVKLFAVDTDGGVFGDTAKKNDNSEEHTDFNGDSEVEDYGKEESDDEHPDVAFGV